jgi:predicted metal-binding membrane protein
MLDAALRHDRTLVVAGLATVIALSWLWLLMGAGLHMDEMDMGGGQVMLMTPPWTPAYAAMIFLMWIIMMAPMMLPSAAPAILFLAARTRQKGERHAIRSSSQFALGYVVVWAAFSLIATGLQFGLDRAGLLSGTMASGSVVLAAALLIAAGVYQWTPWKQACLQHCRSPLDFLTRYWRQDPLGPMRAGAWHGAFCLGCCWMLMGLLFVGGLMNMLWVAGLAVLVLIEKLFPLGPRVSQLTGAALIVWGVFVLVHRKIHRKRSKPGRRTSYRLGAFASASAIA